MNPEVLEKYLALASFTFFSAACGLTISKPCIGVKATLEAVPETCLFTEVAPPHCCCFCMFLCRVLEIRTLVFSSTWGSLIRPVPVLPIVPRLVRGLARGLTKIAESWVISPTTTSFSPPFSLSNRRQQRILRLDSTTDSPLSGGGSDRDNHDGGLSECLHENLVVLCFLQLIAKFSDCAHIIQGSHHQGLELWKSLGHPRQQPNYWLLQSVDTQGRILLQIQRA
ncbi:hypothetical protein B566_EDAN009631 [Ephemera danica]|nr:hypothetical protein B566_EDAN009631 [Ephemera danica]